MGEELKRLMAWVTGANATVFGPQNRTGELPNAFMGKMKKPVRILSDTEFDEFGNALPPTGNEVHPDNRNIIQRAVGGVNNAIAQSPVGQVFGKFAENLGNPVQNPLEVMDPATAGIRAAVRKFGDDFGESLFTGVLFDDATRKGVITGARDPYVLVQGSDTMIDDLVNDPLGGVPDPIAAKFMERFPDEYTRVLNIDDVTPVGANPMRSAFNGAYTNAPRDFLGPRAVRSMVQDLAQAYPETQGIVSSTRISGAHGQAADHLRRQEAAMRHRLHVARNTPGTPWMDIVDLQDEIKAVSDRLMRTQAVAIPVRPNLIERALTRGPVTDIPDDVEGIFRFFENYRDIRFDR